MSIRRITKLALQDIVNLHPLSKVLVAVLVLAIAASPIAYAGQFL